MRIGFFTDSYSPSADGVATSVETCAKELQKKGHTVYVVAPSYPHAKAKKGVYRLYSIRIMKSPEIWLGIGIPPRSLFKIMNMDLDIVHGHSGGPVSFLGWELAQVRNIPFVETYHTLWKFYRHYLFYPSLLKLWMLKRVIGLIGNDCDAIITPSVKAKNDLVSSRIKKPIYVVPNGINLQEFKKGKTDYLRRTFHVPAANKILLTVGRLEKEKSIDFLIKAFSAINHKIPDTTLVIVGDGGEKNNLLSLVEKYKMLDKIIFTGKVKHTAMPEMYAGADIFIFASKSETQGMVLTEAMASSLPVVAVEDSAFNNLIQNHINGYLVPKDPLMFAGKVIHILKDDALQKELGNNAVEMSSQFSIQSTTTMLENVYSQIIIDKKNYKLNVFKRVLNTSAKRLLLGVRFRY